MSESPHPFADVPDSPRGHLGLLFYQSVCHLILYLQQRASASGSSPAKVFESFAFLSSYWNELRARVPEANHPEQFLSILRAECERREHVSKQWLPFRALRQEASFSADALLWLVMAGLIEEDARFGDVFSALQHPLPYRRPTLGLLQLVVQLHASSSDGWATCQPLISQGLLVAANREAPRAEWELRVPSPLWSALRGEYAEEPIPGVHHHPFSRFVTVAELILAPGQKPRIAELVSLLRRDAARTVVVRGLAGSPAIEVLGGIARELGRGLLEVDGQLIADEERRRLIGSLARLNNAIPVFTFELGTGETQELASLVGYGGPVGVSLTREGGLTGALLERSVTIELEPDGPEQRLAFWQQELKDHTLDDLRPIAQGFTMSGGHIRKAAQIAATHAALDGRNKIASADVRQATRHLSQRLEFLATKLNGGGGWSDLVVSAATERALRALETRCRHREKLATSLGPDLPGGVNRGVRALFEGPSGTGKTLAAKILAAELGLDVYRVDLAALMNKYIGETEKNLSRVLSRAEDLDVVLLLDEGDSLMSRRTDVKTAHDRYANLETNYLLQRLETYLGIVVVTTNVGSTIDNAFRRRIDAIVKFHTPAAEERWRLWQLHLSSGHAITPADLESIALRCEMTGGQIRNAAVQAALLAMEDAQAAITAAHLRDAIRAEYRKAGAAVPLEENRFGHGQENRLDGFLAAIS